jgi:hypothetical protein
MAKRKAASRRRKPVAKRAKGSSAARASSARKSISRAGASKSRGRKRAAPKARARKKTAVTRGASKKAAAPRKVAPKKAALRRRVTASKKKTARTATVTAKASRPQKAAAKTTLAPRRTPTPAVARKAPALSRERRIVRDDDMLPSPPSTLDLDRSASSARSGRRELRERFDEHTETGPALTGGDVDADWESAYSVGDEAPGGDNPTPDQDLVDDIGRAVGVEYQDNEELKGDEKISKRDRHRWELDPASSEDYDDR